MRFAKKCKVGFTQDIEKNKKGVFGSWFWGKYPSKRGFWEKKEGKRQKIFPNPEEKFISGNVFGKNRRVFIFGGIFGKKKGEAENDKKEF